MTGRGLLRGHPGNWRNYPAALRTLTVGGGSTQPAVSDLSGARYMEIPGGLVVAQVQYIFAIGSVGVGDVYALRLPRPVDRQSSPLVDGTGYIYTPFATYQDNMPVVPKLFTSGQFVELAPGDEDWWIGFQYPHYLEQGTATMPAGTAGQLTVSHACPWTPKPSEVVVTPTGLATGGLGVVFPFIVTPASGNFLIDCYNTPAAGQQITLAYKIRSSPNGGTNSMIGPAKPWAWGGLYDIFVQFYYAART